MWPLQANSVGSGIQSCGGSCDQTATTLGARGFLRDRRATKCDE